jgi:hypothetical protein
MSFVTCRVAGCYNYLVAVEMELVDYDVDTGEPTGKPVTSVTCGGGCNAVADVADTQPADAIDTATFLEQTAAGTWTPGVGPVEAAQETAP